VPVKKPHPWRRLRHLEKDVGQFIAERQMLQSEKAAAETALFQLGPILRAYVMMTFHGQNGAVVKYSKACKNSYSEADAAAMVAARWATDGGVGGSNRAAVCPAAWVDDNYAGMVAVCPACVDDNYAGMAAVCPAVKANPMPCCSKSHTLPWNGVRQQQFLYVISKMQADTNQLYTAYSTSATLLQTDEGKYKLFKFNGQICSSWIAANDLPLLCITFRGGGSHDRSQEMRLSTATSAEDTFEIKIDAASTVATKDALVEALRFGAANHDTGDMVAMLTSASTCHAYSVYFAKYDKAHDFAESSDVSVMHTHLNAPWTAFGPT